MRTLRAASLLALIAACSEPGSQPAMLPDSSPPPPPITGPVSIRIAVNTTPMAGVTVMFQDGSVVESVQTDAAGVATARMRSGGSVTALNPFGVPAAGDPDELRTMMGVRIGDVTQLVKRSPAAITVRVTAPVDPGAASHVLHTSCGSGPLLVSGQTVSNDVTLRGCTTADMLVESFDAAGESLRSLFVPAVELADAGSVTLTGGYQTIPDARLDYASVPEGYDQVTGRSMLVTGLRRILERTNTVPLRFGVGSTQLSLPTVPDATLITQSTFQHGGVGVHHVLDLRPVDLTVGLDFSRTLLPDYLAAPEFTAPGTISWLAPGPEFIQLESSVPPQHRPHSVIVGLHGVRTAEPARTWNWKIVAPFESTFVILPALPAGPDGFDYNAASGDTLSIAELTTVGSPFGDPGLHDELLSGEPATLSEMLIDEMIRQRVPQIAIEQLR